jgi:tripartite-type tricarboxylate transporter receptor subunit TctC
MGQHSQRAAGEAASGIMTARATGAFAVASLIVAAAAVHAQTPRRNATPYPDKPVHIVVAAAAGGINDILARVVGQKLAESFGQPVVIDNRPGAATIIGTEYAARSRPDGYTLLSAPMASMAVNPAVYPKLSYVPRSDFVPISLIASYAYLLGVTDAAPVHDVRELIDHIKANPGKANAGGASVTFQLTTELFKQRTGTQIQYIPYKGSHEANLALISGELLLSFVDSGPAAPLVRSGQIRALATTAPTRMPSFPELPTMAEAGVADMTAVSWSGFFAPAGTPAAIVGKLEAEIIRIVKLPDVRERLRAQELELVGSTSSAFAQILAKDIETWAAIAKSAKIALEP